MKIEHSKPKVTVMIPTYNQAPLIRDAIDSALAQNYPNLEVIVGDDASSDDTPQVVSSIKDSRLKYIRNSVNLGRTNNYKKLLDNHATGDFVVNLDGDDYYTDVDFIAEAVNLIGKNQNVVMIVARVTTKFKHGECVSKIPEVESATGMQILKKIPNKNYMVMHMGVLYDRKRAIEIDFYRSFAISSDWESLYRLTLRGEVKYLDRNIGVWRIHGENTTGTTDIKKHLENLTIWQAIYKDAISFGMPSILAKLCCIRCVVSYAQSSCIFISKTGNSELLKFVFLVFKNYKFAFLIIAMTPKYATRLALCFCGYYRK